MLEDPQLTMTKAPAVHIRTGCMDMMTPAGRSWAQNILSALLKTEPLMVEFVKHTGTQDTVWGFSEKLTQEEEKKRKSITGMCCCVFFCY